MKNGKLLSIHSYSNYVMQHMLTFGPESYKNNLYDEIILKNFVELSVDKFARYFFFFYLKIKFFFQKNYISLGKIILFFEFIYLYYRFSLPFRIIVM